MQDLRFQSEMTNKELADLKENSNETELKSVLEDMAVLMDEKQSLENRLKETVREVDLLKKKLCSAEEKFCKAENMSKDLEVRLDGLTADKRSLEEKIVQVEKENKSVVDSLQQQLQGHAVAAEESEDRLRTVEGEKKEKDAELKMSLDREEELQNQQKTLKDELDFLLKKFETSKEESNSIRASKDAEMEDLRVELLALKEESRKRVEQLSKQSDAEEATNHELSSIKAELLNIHRQLESSENDRNKLAIQIEERKNKINGLKAELEGKSKELSILSTNFEDAKISAARKIEETVKDYENKLDKLTKLHQDEMKELQQIHASRIQIMEAEMEQNVTEQEEKINQIEEENLNAKHENSLLVERIKYMEQELAEELEKVQDVLHQSNETHKDEVKDLKSVNDRLTRELNQQHSLVESLEDEMKRLLEVQQDKSVRNEQEFSQLHSAALNEKNQMKTAFDEEKEILEIQHNKKLERLKEEYQNQKQKIEEDHAKKILATVTELRESHQAERDSLKDRIHLLEEEIKATQMEFQRSEIDLKTLTNHYEQEERKWKENLTQTVEEIKASHQKEILELKAETDDLIQQSMHQLDSNSLNSELLQSQLMQLQEENINLHTEIKNLKNSKEKREETLQHKLNEITNEKESLVKKTNELEKGLQDANDQISHMQVSITLEREKQTEKLTLQQEASVFSPNLDQTKVYQEETASLTALIKGKSSYCNFRQHSFLTF